MSNSDSDSSNDVQIVSNVSGILNALKGYSADAKTTEINALKTAIATNADSLKNYHTMLQGHLYNAKNNVINQHSLMQLSRAEQNRLEGKISSLKDETNYNNRVAMHSRNSNKRLQVYTRLLVTLLVVIFIVIGLFYIKNGGLISESILTILLSVVIFVSFMYAYFVLSDLISRDKMDFDKYVFSVPEKMTKTVKMDELPVDDRELSLTNMCSTLQKSLDKAAQDAANDTGDVEPSTGSNVDSFAVYN